MADLATSTDLAKAWRPIRTGEEDRVEYWLGAASRRIRRRWRDVEDRITAGTLDAADVSDVVVHMVMRVMAGPATPDAKSWAVAAGSESQSVALDKGRGDDLLTIEDWMVDVFEATEAPATPGPIFSAPPSGRYENLFQWKEERW